MLICQNTIEIFQIENHLSYVDGNPLIPLRMVRCELLENKVPYLDGLLPINDDDDDDDDNNDDQVHLNFNNIAEALANIAGLPIHKRIIVNESLAINELHIRILL